MNLKSDCSYCEIGSMSWIEKEKAQVHKSLIGFFVSKFWSNPIKLMDFIFQYL